MDIWSSNTFYGPDIMVIGSDNNLYRSLSKNIGLDPTTHSDVWRAESSTGSPITPSGTVVPVFAPTLLPSVKWAIVVPISQGTSPDWSYDGSWPAPATTVTANANGAINDDPNWDGSGNIPSVGDRVVVMDQYNQYYQLFTVTDVGSGSTPWVLTATTDDVTGTWAVTILEGTTWSGGVAISKGIGTNNWSGSTASGDQSVASGTYSTASGNGSVASGANSTASGNQSTASGPNSTASAYGSIASGYGSKASGFTSVASGYASTASGYQSVASGYASTGSGDQSVASGYVSTASGPNSVASGFQSTASGESSVASGYYSTASGSDSVASGNGSTASGDSSTASGNASTASGICSTASGYASTAYSDGQVVDSSVGSVAQSGRVTVAAVTVDATPTLACGLTPTPALTIQDASQVAVWNRTIRVSGVVVARRIDTPGTDSSWTIPPSVLRGNGTNAYTWLRGTAPVLTVDEQDAAASGWAVALSISGNTLNLTVTGEAANTIQWQATIELAEVAG